MRSVIARRLSLGLDRHRRVVDWSFSCFSALPTISIPFHLAAFRATSRTFFDYFPLRQQQPVVLRDINVLSAC